MDVYINSDFLFSLSTIITVSISSFLSKCFDFIDIPNPIRYLEARNQNKHYHCIDTATNVINQDKKPWSFKDNVIAHYMKGNSNAGSGECSGPPA
jgi:hypothetical protein